MLGSTKGKVEFGGKYEEGGSKRKWGMEPTLVVDVKEDDALLEEYDLLPMLDAFGNLTFSLFSEKYLAQFSLSLLWRMLMRRLNF